MRLGLRHLLAAALLADVEQLARRAARRRAPPRGQPVVQDHVGARDQLRGAHGQQPRVARPGADEVDRHAARSARASRSAAPADSIRSASASASPASSISHSEPSGNPTNALHQNEPSEWTPIGVWHDASSRATTARSAVERRARRRGRRRPRCRSSSPARPCTSRQPCPGAGTNTSPSSGTGDDIRTPQPRQPRRREHQRIDLAGRQLPQPRVDVARAARPPRDRAATRAAAPAAAASSSRRARPEPQRHRPRRRADPPAAARRRSPSRGQLPRHVLRAVHGDVDLALQQRTLERARPARLVAGIALQIARGRDLDDRRPPRAAHATQRACASASALPRVPTAAAQGLRSSRTSAAGRCRLGSRLVEPEQLAQQRQPRVAAVGVERLDALRRLVQQPLDRRPQHRLDALAVALAERLPARLVLGQQLGHQPVGLLAQRRDRRQHLQRSQPAREALDLLLDDALGAPRLDPALGVRARDLRLQPVDVDQRDARQRRAVGIDVARHREVEQQQRPAAARPRDDARAPPRPRSRAARPSTRRRCRPARARRGSASNAIVEPPNRSRQRDRPLAPAVGDEDRPHALLGQRARRQLRGLAGADDQHVARARARRARRAPPRPRRRRCDAPPAPIAVSVRTRLPVASAARNSLFVSGPVVRAASAAS